MQVDFTTTIKEKEQTFKAEATTLITNDKELALIELHGPMTTVRAIWAHVVKSRKSNEVEQSDIKVNVGIGWTSLWIPGGTKFNKLEEKNYLLLWSPAWGEKKRSYIFGGDLDTPPIHFMDGLRQNVLGLPVLSKWEKELWKAGIEGGQIIPLNTYNASLFAWDITPKGSSSDIESWPAILQRLVLNGTVSSS